MHVIDPIQITPLWELMLDSRYLISVRKRWRSKLGGRNSVLTISGEDYSPGVLLSVDPNWFKRFSSVHMFSSGMHSSRRAILQYRLEHHQFTPVFLFSETTWERGYHGMRTDSVLISLLHASPEFDVFGSHFILHTFD